MSFKIIFTNYIFNLEYIYITWFQGTNLVNNLSVNLLALFFFLFFLRKYYFGHKNLFPFEKTMDIAGLIKT